jgi:hypothetical protein
MNEFELLSTEKTKINISKTTNKRHMLMLYDVVVCDGGASDLTLDELQELYIALGDYLEVQL